METTVSQMSVGELRKLISDVVSDVVEEKLAANGSFAVTSLNLKGFLPT